MIDINARNEYGITPLWAAFIGSEGEITGFLPHPSFEMVKYLLDKGANPNVSYSLDFDGYTETMTLLKFLKDSMLYFGDKKNFQHDEDRAIFCKKMATLLKKYGAK